ncbi:hypothetical protein [Winogradskyella ouciana]|uniref:hypothetical protein n=1 Tax=Winogradskyella ouciana TaxID=2608631 RepID=UPI003D2E6A19
MVATIDGNIDTLAMNNISKSNKTNFSYKTLDDFVYFSIDSEELYVASICICSNDTISVYHSSAALGDALYKKLPEGNWQKNETFEWDMRETDTSNETVEKRIHFYQKNGWIANTMAMGKTGETEFIFNKSLFKNGKLTIALGLMYAHDPENILALPTTSKDGCGSLSLVSGSPEKSYKFDTDNWFSLTLE